MAILLDLFAATVKSQRNLVFGDYLSGIGTENSFELGSTEI